MNPEVKILECDDLETILYLKMKSDGSQNRKKSLDRLQNIYDSTYKIGEFDFFNISIEDKVVGFAIGYSAEESDTYESRWIYVDENYRRKDFGSKLLKAQIELAKKFGFVTLKVYFQGNTLLNFYRGNGITEKPSNGTILHLLYN